jgi:hypothetical protein
VRSEIIADEEADSTAMQANLRLARLLQTNWRTRRITKIERATQGTSGAWKATWLKPPGGESSDAG